MINSNRPRFTSLHVGLHGTGAITATCPEAQSATRASPYQIFRMDERTFICREMVQHAAQLRR